jgi:predicted HAD superfamily Cof-like phosphohydrolase
MSELETQFNKVKEFHTVFGHPINSSNYYLTSTNPTLIPFRLSLIKEEINELLEAYANKDLIEIIDACADILYVIYGACLAFGIDNIGYGLLFHSANTNTNETMINKQSIKEHMEIMKSLLNDLNDTTPSKYQFIFRQLILYVYNICNDLCVNINDCFNEVHRSNMTKVCLIEQEAIDTVTKYKTTETRYASPSYRKSDGYYVIFDKETSKILKSIKYESPNLNKILNIIKIKVIGITGRKGVGKDTLGKFLVDNKGYERLGFADALKEATKNIFGFNDEQVYGNLKENVDEFWQKSPREILQYLGTNVFRNSIQDFMPNVGKDLWIHVVKRKILNRLKENPDAKFVITDVRFQNEIDAIHELGGKIIKVSRTVTNDANSLHESEMSIDTLETDYVINNNSSINELWTTAINMLC